MSKKYTTVAGDTLASVMYKFHIRTAAQRTAFFTANPRAHSNILAPHTILVIPEGPVLGDDGKAYIYIVQQGDTLESIARQFAVTPEWLCDRNTLGDPPHLVVGQKVLVPSPEPDPGTAPPTPAAPAAGGPDMPAASQGAGPEQNPPDPPGRYTVRQGDRLATVAAQFGTTVEWLADRNTIADPDQLQPGRHLIIPIHHP